MDPSTRPFDAAKYLSQIKGKDYLEVKWRLLWLRTDHPDADIITELVKLDKDASLFKASIVIPGRGSATGYGSETATDFADYIEKAETKAIGRALAALGFGTQFADLDDTNCQADAAVKRPRAAAPGSTKPAPVKAHDGPPDEREGLLSVIHANAFELQIRNIALDRRAQRDGHPNLSHAPLDWLHEFACKLQERLTPTPTAIEIKGEYNREQAVALHGDSAVTAGDEWAKRVLQPTGRPPEKPLQSTGDPKFDELEEFFKKT